MTLKAARSDATRSPKPKPVTRESLRRSPRTDRGTPEPNEPSPHTNVRESNAMSTNPPSGALVTDRLPRSHADDVGHVARDELDRPKSRPAPNE